MKHYLMLSIHKRYRVWLSQQLVAQIDFQVFAVMTRNCHVVSSVNVTRGRNKPALEDLVTLSVETQHESRFIFLTCPQIVIWVRAQSCEQGCIALLMSKCAKHGLHINQMFLKGILKDQKDK